MRELLTSVVPVRWRRAAADLVRRVVPLRFPIRSSQGHVLVPRGWRGPPSATIEVYVLVGRTEEVTPEIATAWLHRQTLSSLRVIACTTGGVRAFTTGDRDDDMGGWFAAAGSLPDVLPCHLECAALIAAAEDVDAVVLRERVPPSLVPLSAIEATRDPLRRRALYRSSSYRWDPANDTVEAIVAAPVVKYIDTAGVALDPGSVTSTANRRGPYLLTSDPGPVLEIGIRDASRVSWPRSEATRPRVLVTAPFLARGGAEQTLHATLRELTGDFDFLFATLAPHRPELGDRRDDFRVISERLYPLGDLVHPAAMYGMLLSLIDAWNVDVLYNANGTTLFYEFGPRIKRDRPHVRIIDHLYDHRIGYIEAYTPETPAWLDVCIAENRPIRDELVQNRGWSADRVPVIWPCGRPPNDLPDPSTHADVRHRLRRDLGYGDDDLIILTAARMHPQKRPLDLVHMARRVRDIDNLHVLIVGGGALEHEVDQEIRDTGGAQIRRLPFRNDIPALITMADVGCLVSDYEGLPVFLLECLQLGRPFLGTDVGDLGSVLRDTGAGEVVDTPGDLAALEAAVRRLANPDHRSRLAHLAATAGRRFAPAACAARYARVFRGETAP